jgi:hypothetical protein
MTLDERIVGLLPDVDEQVRRELQDALRTLREAENIPGSIVTLSRLLEGYRGFLATIASAGGYTLQPSVLEQQIEALTRNKIVPGEIASDLHWIRVRANKARHAAEERVLAVEDAEMCLDRLLNVVEWFYCRYDRGLRLRTVYSQAESLAERFPRRKRTSTPVSPAESIRARIVETLIQFANYRLETRIGFMSRNPNAPGDMATCEGLETFLVPAVEGAVPFSTFLDEYDEKGGDSTKFAQALLSDIKDLLANWERGFFSGKPYTNDARIYAKLEPSLKKEVQQINITESAAMACRVLVHLLTLKLRRSNETRFQKEIADYLDEASLFGSLSKAVGFLVGAFQKGSGKTQEDQIKNATVRGYSGSGWSWTDFPGLPPMLFFTATAVDAFAELDCYLLRPAQIERENNGNFEFITFHDDHNEMLENFRLCIDMAGRWVEETVLPYLVDGYGQFVERLTQRADELGEELKYEKSFPEHQQSEVSLSFGKKLSHSPIVFYNNLYGLLILLWASASASEESEALNDYTQNKIARAVSQLIYNYNEIAEVKEILTHFEYVFYLPVKPVFQRESEREPAWIDSAFVPHLTRLVVILAASGGGDRSMLELVMNNLYVELLQSRHRYNVKYSALWSTEAIEVFSTQRAIQALSFYHAYVSRRK